MKLNKNHPLHNRTLHISDTFNETEKPDIEDSKANIEAVKVNIEKMFSPTTAAHVRKLQETFGHQTIFGRSDVQKTLGLKATRSSALLHEMVEHGMIEPVSGHGKGKYRFANQRIE